MPRIRYDWSQVDWTRPSAEIALYLGCCGQSVAAARRRYNKRRGAGIKCNWLVVTPDGQRIHVRNLKAWCGGNHTLYSGLIAVANGRSHAYGAGWLISRA
jgi:hypothetical protein